MGRPTREHIPGGFFHVTQRGNNRQAIFVDDQDRLRYLGALSRALEAGGERLHAYCLMTNHVHLLLQATERPLSPLMKLLGGSYARAFNDRWARAGHLFQGRFYSVHVPSDPHVLLILRYIHLNPCAAGLVADPRDHPWSSHVAYLADGAPPWLCRSYVRGLLHPDPTAARTRYAELMRAGVHALAVHPLEQPVVALPSGRRQDEVDWSLVEGIVREVARRSGCSREEICGGSSGHRAAAARAAIVFLARSLANASLAGLSALLRRDVATLGNAVTRHRQRSAQQEDDGWHRLVLEVRHSLAPEVEKRSA